jgi:hypothetical protein
MKIIFNREYNKIPPILNDNGYDTRETQLVGIYVTDVNKLSKEFVDYDTIYSDGDYVGDIHYIHHANREQAEVIGNVFENADLLKKGQ